jgi:hypothetical protein
MFKTETERKDQLLTLLENLEVEVKFKPHQKTLKFGFYDRIFNGVAEIERVGNATLRLKRENGGSLGVLVVTSDIVAFSRKGDHLMVTLGHRHGQWHLIQILMIGSYLVDENGQRQMHLSGRNSLPPSRN